MPARTTPLDLERASVLEAMIATERSWENLDPATRPRRRLAGRMTNPRTAVEHMVAENVGRLEWEELDAKERRVRIGEALGAFAYHVRELERLGVLTHRGTGRKRGALVHFYAHNRQAVGALADELLGHAITLASLIQAPASTLGDRDEVAS